MKQMVRVRSGRAEPGRLAAVLDGERSAVDRVAARVAGKGEVFHSCKLIRTADRRRPIDVRPVSAIPAQHRSLIGSRFGRMTVIGLSFKPKRWVVRCDCGIYTLRTAQAARNPGNNADCCEECRHLLFLKRHEVWRRTGKEVGWDALPGMERLP